MIYLSWTLTVFGIKSLKFEFIEKFDRDSNVFITSKIKQFARLSEMNAVMSKAVSFDGIPIQMIQSLIPFALLEK